MGVLPSQLFCFPASPGHSFLTPDFSSPQCALWEHHSLGISHHQLCSPYLLPPSPASKLCWQDPGTLMALTLKKQPSSPFLLLLMVEEDEQVGHLSDVLYILPSSFVATSRLSEESSIQVTTRVAAEKDLPSSELWGQLFCKELWRQMQFLLPSAWSCCREVLLQVHTCLSQDIAKTVSYETQLSCSIQQASTLEEGIFSPFN